ncbi:hypothetical protein K7472_17095 [Streptomyces sp. PTM05]|uniref:Uncharacterized protein n=1 Tax=Streptantibioticus parmotrematis TaxID=2873249 RepID=A0ABS7QTP8_9ACTN|nr:hypothetical protein [Streptantibioticus parmotrematis]MBY8886569.1 hypothetical protein [Streptantibioticus parmotrematis]
MSAEHPDPRVVADVRALVADLLPVLVPHALLDPDSGLLVLPGGTCHAEVSLHAIVADCASLPPAAWPERVRAWLAQKTSEVASALDERRRLGDVELLLRVQITPRLPRDERERLMCVPYGDLLDVVIAIDHPEGGRLTRDRAEQLALPDPGRRAIANTLRDELPAFEVTEQHLPGVGRVRVVHHDRRPYVTSALLDLERFLPGACPYGALVAMPDYGRVLLLPVRPDELPATATGFADLAREDHATTDTPCTDQVLWWAGDTLRAIGLTRLRKRARIPRALRALVRHHDHQPRTA